MAAWTLAEAQAHLALWLAADSAVATGQSYTIGTRSLTRANSKEIAERIAYWRREVDRLESGRTSVIRFMRAVPRDL